MVLYLDFRGITYLHLNFQTVQIFLWGWTFQLDWHLHQTSYSISVHQRWF